MHIQQLLFVNLIELHLPRKTPTQSPRYNCEAAPVNRFITYSSHVEK